MRNAALTSDMRCRQIEKTLGYSGQLAQHKLK
jgi:hypothetical protein